jgi:hypothetical protein
LESTFISKCPIRGQNSQSDRKAEGERVAVEIVTKGKIVIVKEWMDLCKVEGYMESLKS